MDKRIEELLEQLSSEAPIPGGGSASALAGAMGGALAQMVWRLTKAQGGGSDTVPDSRLEDLQRLGNELGEAFERDAACYAAVVDAMRLPQTTEEEQRRRTDAIQTALREATLAPLETARRCAEVMDLSLSAVHHGFPGAVSDAGVAALLAYSGLVGALYNVEINAGGIDDERFVETMAQEISALRAEAEDKLASADEEVRRRLSQ